MTADRQNTPQDAPRAPVSDFQAPQAPGDATTAPDAAERAQRYAEAIVRACMGTEALAAMAVADQELDELRAEVERLRQDIDECWVPLYHGARADAEAAEARLAAVEALGKNWLRLSGTAMEAEVREWTGAAGRSVLAALAVEAGGENR